MSAFIHKPSAFARNAGFQITSPVNAKLAQAGVELPESVSDARLTGRIITIGGNQTKRCSPLINQQLPVQDRRLLVDTVEKGNTVNHGTASQGYHVVGSSRQFRKRMNMSMLHSLHTPEHIALPVAN
jgi:hypothetical protein